MVLLLHVIIIIIIIAVRLNTWDKYTAYGKELNPAHSLTMSTIHMHLYKASPKTTKYYKLNRV